MPETPDANIPLPSFEDPPVQETVLSVRFEPLGKLTSGYVGRLWAEKFLERFPKTEDYQPLPPIVEDFSRRRPVRVQAELSAGHERAPLFRTWFVDEPGTELIQVQQDRFVRNWRKREDSVYPRFPALREAFLADLELFSEFVREQGLGSIKPIQCEVSYINHIPSEHAAPEDVFAFWSGRFTTEFRPKVEDARVQIRFVIPGEDGNPIGRLYATMQPAFLVADDSAVYYYELTARSASFDNGRDGMLSFLDIAREWIVRGFASTTLPRMWELWRRSDE